MEETEMMDERDYRLKNQYRQRDNLSQKQYGRKYHTYGQTDQEESLSYGARFRLRLLLCVIFFLSFIFSDHFMLDDNEMQIFYRKLEETTSEDEWKNYAVTAFKEIKGFEK